MLNFKEETMINSLSVSPMLQARITQQNDSVLSLQNQSLQNAKSDTLELPSSQKMPKSKKLLMIASLIGVAAVGIGALILANKGKIIQLEGSKIQKTAVKNQTSAKATIDEVMTLLDKVKGSPDGSKVLEEVAEDGKTLVRKSTLFDGFLTIDDFVEKTRIEALDGELIDFYKGFEIFEDGSLKAKEGFRFAGNELRSWVKNCKQNADGTYSVEKEMYFGLGKVMKFAKNICTNADGDADCQKVIKFDFDGKIEK